MYGYDTVCISIFLKITNNAPTIERPDERRSLYKGVVTSIIAN